MAGGRDDAAIAQALASMAQVLAQANEQAAVGHRDPGEAEERRFDQFLRNSPPTFKGRYDPDGAQTWMQAMESLTLRSPNNVIIIIIIRVNHTTKCHTAFQNFVNSK